MPHRSLFLALAVTAAALAAASAKPTAYEALGGFDFPPGILPKGAVAYTLDNSTGAFTATLDSSPSGGPVCEFSIQGSYSLRYQTKISGKISPGRIADLQGVSVKVLFFWFNIIEVARSGDKMGFSIGVASADFGIDDFFECPTCGCGFDCNNLTPVLREPAAGTAKPSLRGAF
jgi:hypothetical protein